MESNKLGTNDTNPFGDDVSGNKVQIRPATPEDAQAIAEIHVRTWKSAYEGILPDKALSALVVADRFRLWQRLLGDAHSPVNAHVAEVRGKVVGFCSVGLPQDQADQGPDVAELFAIYVEPGSQERGIGTRLLIEAERTMRDWGAFAGVLWVLTDNETAKSFYARNGWSADGTIKNDTILGREIQESRFRKAFFDRND